MLYQITEYDQPPSQHLLQRQMVPSFFLNCNNTQYVKSYVQALFITDPVIN